MGSSRREFVFGRLNDGVDAMKVWGEAQKRFGHCTWNYVDRLRREWAMKARESQLDTKSPPPPPKPKKEGR